MKIVLILYAASNSSDDFVLLCSLARDNAARIQRRETGNRTPPPPTLKKHKVIGFFGNTGPYPLKYYKATKPAFNVGPSSAHQRNAF